MEMLKTVLEGNLMQQIIQYMLTDIIEVFQYIPDGVMSGILFFVFVLIVKGILRLLKLDGKLSITRCAVMSFLAAYLVIFLEIVFLSREPGTRTGVDLQLFETWGTNAQAHAYVIENILLFIPFGFLVPFVFFKGRKGLGTFCLGMFLSIGCEYAQFITQRGHCQLDDVVMNTLGTILGYMGYWCICCIFHLICRVKKRLGKGLLPMKKIQYWIPAILMMIAIFYFSSQPGDISGDLSGGISYKIVSLVSDLFQKDWNHEKILIWAEKIDFPVRKLAHLTEYALLGLAMAFGVQGGFNDHSTANRKKMRNNKIGYRHLYLYVQMIGSLYAASDELHQLFVPGRAGRIGDVVIDSIGVLIGWFVWLFVV